MIYTVDKITSLIGARRHGNTDRRICWLLTDSRSLCFPEETLFFALKTARNDGHQYIADLYRRGVRCFVVENVPANYASVFPEACFLKVKSTLRALQRLAERHRDEFDLPVIGITGSNGKTVVKEWLYQLLSPTFVITRSPRSYNSQTGVPLSVWLLHARTQIGIFEAGISEPHEMAPLHDIIQPTIGIMTNIGTAHQENFASPEEKCLEKMHLFRDAEVLIYPADDDTVRACLDKSEFRGRRVAWSCHDATAEMYVKSIVKEDDATTVRYVYDGNEGEYRLPFIDDASVSNSVCCAATVLWLGLSGETLAGRMADIEPVAMRLEVKEGLRGCTLINDAYNSDINSLGIALDFMNRRPEHAGRQRTIVLSDIMQSGRNGHELYGEVSDMAVKRGVHKFIGIGKEITANADAINIEDKHFFPDVASFAAADVFRSLRDEVILLKGARQFCFEHLTEMLEQRVHETILEVNLTALVNNLNHFRSFLRAETKMACMVKANAYGSGAVEVAKTLQDHCVDYLAVAVADEGVTLRKAGITANIMVMNPEMTSFKTMFDYDLEPEVYSFRLLDALTDAARREGITDYPVHIKIDTGMHRLGFDPENDMDELIRRLKSGNAIIPRSVFSHFVGSDSDDFDNFSALQFERFDKASRQLQAAFSHKILRHIDNSAGIEHFPERQLDMCRLGIGLYGIDNRTNTIINNVCTLKTTILQLRHVPKEDTVGYSRKGILTRDSVIAALPIGYADGLDRGLGRGRCYCMVNGRKAPYIGNICMDVAMADVTDIDCREGDVVEIFGDTLPVTVLSDALDTIPYEVLTGVSDRVKRVYYQD